MPKGSRPTPSWPTEHLAGRRDVLITNLDWVQLEFVCIHMREIDRREIYGNMLIDNPLQLTHMLMQAVSRLGVGWIGRYRGRPAAWIAFFEQWPGNWQITMGGTDDIRFVLFDFMPLAAKGFKFAVDNGAHRVECRSLAEHREAGKLAKLFGANLEGRLSGYGRDGSDYQSWAWTGHGLKAATKERKYVNE